MPATTTQSLATSRSCTQDYVFRNDEHTRVLARGHPLHVTQQMSGVGLDTCNTHTTHNSTVQYDVVFTYDVRDNK